VRQFFCEALFVHQLMRDRFGKHQFVWGLYDKIIKKFLIKKNSIFFLNINKY